MFKVERKGNEGELLGNIVIKYGDQSIEYPIEETQDLIDMLPYEEDYKKQTFLDKVYLIINNPFLTIPTRVVWLIGRLIIAMVAMYGAYTMFNIYETTYTPEKLESIKTVIYILNNFGTIIRLYVVWDILSTLLRIYNEAKVEIQRIKN